MNKEEKQSRITFWVSPETKRQFHIYCLQNETDMTSQLRDFIYQKIEENNKE